MNRTPEEHEAHQHHHVAETTLQESARASDSRADSDENKKLPEERRVWRKNAMTGFSIDRQSFIIITA